MLSTGLLQACVYLDHTSRLVYFSIILTTNFSPVTVYNNEYCTRLSSFLLTTVHYNALLAMLNACDKLANRHAMANSGILNTSLPRTYYAQARCRDFLHWGASRLKSKDASNVNCLLRQMCPPGKSGYVANITSYAY